jgi:hypothetical protein
MRWVSGVTSTATREVAGAFLCVTVSALHVVERQRFPGHVAARYVSVGYYVLELAGVVAATIIFAGVQRIGWLLAMGVAAAPFIGYLLSRGPGLPGAGDDRGNWTEPLGIVSLLVEGMLLVLAAGSFLAYERGRRTVIQPPRTTVASHQRISRSR